MYLIIPVLFINGYTQNETHSPLFTQTKMPAIPLLLERERAPPPSPNQPPTPSNINHIYDIWHLLQDMEIEICYMSLRFSCVQLQKVRHTKNPPQRYNTYFEYANRTTNNSIIYIFPSKYA